MYIYIYIYIYIYSIYIYTIRIRRTCMLGERACVAAYIRAYVRMVIPAVNVDY